MRIINSFKDYYDKAMAFDNSERPLWLRKTTTLEKVPESLRAILPTLMTSREAYEACYCIVGCCGKFYLVLLTDLEDYWKYVYKYSLKSKDLLEEIHNQTRANEFTHLHFNQFAITQIAEQLSKLQNDKIFQDLGTPLFCLYCRTMSSRFDWTLTLNDRLPENFRALKDPFTLFQEIESYLENQLAQQPTPPIERTQELIRDSKGFNKNSFKREGVVTLSQPDHTLINMIENFSISNNECMANLDRRMSLLPRTKPNAKYLMRVLRKNFFSPDQKALAFCALKYFTEVEPSVRKILSKEYGELQPILDRIDIGR